MITGTVPTTAHVKAPDLAPSLDLPEEILARASPINELPGVNVLLIGDGGSGKTHALRTLVDCGIEVFIIFTEPGMEVLADIPADKLHWNYTKPASPSFADMIDSARKINTMTFKMLTDLTEIKKSKYANFIDILKSCDNYVCSRTGKSYGSVEDWGPDRALVIDSLSGLGIAAMNLGTGSKPVKNQGDWGVAMDNLDRLITKLCVDTNAIFVLTAHIDRNTDEISGGTTLTVSTLGQKLAPKLTRFFSDVVHVKRKIDKFYWSTVTPNFALKARNLPLKDDIPPTFKTILDKWRAREAGK